MWLSILATLAACAIVAVGGLVTTAGSLPEPPTSFFLTAAGHQRVAEIAGTFLMLYLIWSGIKTTNLTAKKIAWLTLLGVIATGALGFLRGQGLGASPLIGTLHATLASMVVSGPVLIGLLTSSLFSSEPELVEDYGWPSMRSMAAVLPYLVFTQILLGAAFRQGAMGLMLHIIGAIAISTFILMMCAFALNQFPKHKALVWTARPLLTATSAQVFFGIAAFTVRSLTPVEPTALMIVTGAHVVIGALTLAASFCATIMIRRHVMPKGSGLVQSHPAN